MNLPLKLYGPSKSLADVTNKIPGRAKEVIYKDNEHHELKNGDLGFVNKPYLLLIASGPLKRMCRPFECLLNRILLDRCRTHKKTIGT